MKYILLIGLLAVPALGCDSDPAGGGGSGAAGNQGGGGSGASGGASPSCAPVADPGVTDVAGRWAYRPVGSQLTRSPGFDPFHTTIVSVLLVDQQQSGDQITVSATYCDHYTESESTAPVSAVVPDTYRAALKPVSRTGTFAAGDGGLRYRLPVFYEVVGATLADTAQEELPTAADDARVVDQDNDAHPGMTILLQGLLDGAVYVVERKMTELEGVAVSADRIEGRLGFSSEQSVLDTDPPGIKASTAESKSFPDPATCNSTFTMVRVPDDADCASINAHAETLFQ